MTIRIDNNWIQNNIKEFINKKIVILVGAGISVSSGIPDFRSKSGIFKDIKDKYKCKGEDLFNFRFGLESDTRGIYMEYMNILKDLIDKSDPSVTHYVIKWLLDKSIKTRIYTQNIDGLEEKAGIPLENIVYLHGNMKYLRCLNCGHKTEFKVFIDTKCTNCNRSERLRKINSFLHTNIIHYYQDHPESEKIYQCIKKDSDCDLFLVVGTRLNVFGVKNMVKYFSKLKNTRSVFINLEKVNSNIMKYFTYFYKGKSDDFFSTLKECVEYHELDTSLQELSVHDSSIHKKSEVSTHINVIPLKDDKNAKAIKEGTAIDSLYSKENAISNIEIIPPAKKSIKKQILKKMKRLSLSREDIRNSFLVKDGEV